MNPAALAFWQNYLDSLPQPRPANPKIYASYAGTQDMTDELVALYLEGKKTAGSGLVADYHAAGDPLPAVGDFWIVLDSQDRPRVLVETIRVEIKKFKDVKEDVARAEGEGDLSLAYWRQAHGDFWRRFLETLGIQDLNEAEVITEFFKVHRKL